MYFLILLITSGTDRVQMLKVSIIYRTFRMKAKFKHLCEKVSD